MQNSERPNTLGLRKEIKIDKFIEGRIPPSPEAPAVLYSPEMIGVISGIKPVAKLSLLTSEYLQLKKILKEKYRLYCTPAYYSVTQKKYGSHPPTNQIKSNGGKIAFYVSKLKELANKAKRYESVGDTIRLGNVFGYPECCTIFYGSIQTPVTSPDFHIFSYEKSKEFIFYTNNLLREDLKYYLISHHPCSYSCKASVSYAKELLKAIRELRPLFAEKIEKMLKLPILYWPYNKFVLFAGSCSGNTISYSNVERTTRLLNRSLFDEGDKIGVTDKEIEISKNGEIISKIKKENKYDGVIFNFN